MDALANPWVESSLTYHGGGLAAAKRLFPDAPDDWLDLSTGVNAAPYPVGALPDPVYARLPEREDIEALEQAAAKSFGLGAEAAIVAAPGTQALIQMLPQITGPVSHVGILGFTYGEHAHVWASGGVEVEMCDELGWLADANVGVVVNPNNPDGRLTPVADLLTLARDMGNRGKFLIVDEAFMDFAPGVNSLAPHLPLPGVIVLRSFGKTFGLAGLRLGFALCEPSLAERWRGLLGPWAVSGAAVEIGRRAYADSAWLQASAVRLERDAARLDVILRHAGFEIVGGTSLFRLASHANASRIFERLCAAGILTRPFPRQPDWLRFGVPATDADFTRLAAALA